MDGQVIICALAKVIDEVLIEMSKINTDSQLSHTAFCDCIKNEQDCADADGNCTYCGKKHCI